VPQPQMSLRATITQLARERQQSGLPIGQLADQTVPPTPLFLSSVGAWSWERREAEVTEQAASKNRRGLD